jgi:hypothetical protein
MNGATAAGITIIGWTATPRSRSIPVLAQVGRRFRSPPRCRASRSAMPSRCQRRLHRQRHQCRHARAGRRRHCHRKRDAHRLLCRAEFRDSDHKRRLQRHSAIRNANHRHRPSRSWVDHHVGHTADRGAGPEHGNRNGCARSVRRHAESDADRQHAGGTVSLQLVSGVEAPSARSGCPDAAPGHRPQPRCGLRSAGRRSSSIRRRRCGAGGAASR